MFGTMGFSELILILMIVLIIFGAGRLPQIGEGVGKALKGFRKEVHEAPPPTPSEAQQENVRAQSVAASPSGTATGLSSPPQSSPSIVKLNAPYVPGPEMTPGTTASLLYSTSRHTPHAQTPTQPLLEASPNQAISMEERAASPPPTARASYPPLPAASLAKTPAKRPSAIINKDAVARVQAQQAALRAKATSPAAGMSSDHLEDLGEGFGEVVRTFRQAVSDVRTSVDPQMHTIQAEMEAAQKEIQQSIEAAKEPPPVQDDSPKSA